MEYELLFFNQFETFYRCDKHLATFSRDALRKACISVCKIPVLIGIMKKVIGKT
jgi:hypothetical protein